MTIKIFKLKMDVLNSSYKDYCNNVSPDNQALSLKASVYCYNYCVKNKPQKIIDMGSGFTSYVLRLYQKNFSTEDFKIEVYSVDDDKSWLNKTKEFLRRNKVSRENLLLFSNVDVPMLKKSDKNYRKNGKYQHLNDDFLEWLDDPKNTEYVLEDISNGSKVKLPKFDFIIYDMGTMSTRARNLRNAIKLLNKENGVVFVDDLQYYEFFIRKLIKDDDLVFEVLKDETLDKYKRYCGTYKYKKS